jgi:hypothetical protein
MFGIETAAPHCWQNLVADWLMAPHDGHRDCETMGAPHSPQNLTPSGFLNPHDWQSTIFLSFQSEETPTMLSAWDPKVNPPD